MRFRSWFAAVFVILALVGCVRAATRPQAPDALDYPRENNGRMRDGGGDM
jgi:hypothetical protein